MKGYPSEVFKSAADLISHLRRSNDEWIGGNWIFRGQSNATSQLIPSAWRQNSNILFEKTKAEIKKDFKLIPTHPDYFEIILDHTINNITDDETLSTRLRHYLWHIICEVYLIHKFIHISNTSGLKVPCLYPFGKIDSLLSFSGIIDEHLTPPDKHTLYYVMEKTKEVKEPLDLTKKVFCELINDPSFKLDSILQYFSNKNFFPSIALAQHHGIPTRFLDWTKDPLKALYFSIMRQKKNTSISVFAFNSKMLSSNINVTEDFPHADFAFLHKQEALFTYATGGDAFFLKHGRWPAIEDFLINTTPLLAILKKFTLPASQIDELRKLLHAEGISQASLMPTYNHIAESVISFDY